MISTATSIGSLTRQAARAGFTLVEVILAVAIATGILLVALVLYRQAADLRARILQESERLAAMRMVLDRLAGEFRSAQTDKEPGGEFTGDGSSVRFVRLTLNAPTASLTLTTNSVDRGDRIRVYFSAALETNGTQVVVHALNRTEEPMPLSTGLASGTNVSDSLVRPTNRVAEALIDTVRFIRFRYWGGAEWLESWSNAVPPGGVEVILANDGPTDESQRALPEDPFRRVIHIPAGAAPASSSSNSFEVVSPR